MPPVNGRRAGRQGTAIRGADGMSCVPLADGDWIRGISIQQPHAACILTGDKGTENRPKPWIMSGSESFHRVDQALCSEAMSSTS